MMQRANFRKGVRCSAPFVLYWKHVQKERKLGKNLMKEKSDSGLWTWATSKIKQDPSTFLARVTSILGEIHRLLLIQRRITEAKNITADGMSVRAASNRTIALGRFEDRFKEFWNKRTVKITKNGDFRIDINKNRGGLICKTTPKLCSRVGEAKKDAVIYFAHEGITLMVGGGNHFPKVKGGNHFPQVKRKNGKKWEIVKRGEPSWIRK